MAAANDSSAYLNVDGPPFSTATPSWLNKGDNAWQMTAATLVGMQSVPGLVILYGSYVKKKWAVNSAFMALYAFAAVLIVWVLCGYRMSFGDKLLPFWGKAGLSLTHQFLLQQSNIPSASIPPGNLMNVSYTGITADTQDFPMATMVYFQFVFAAITLILVAGSLLGRMNILAWGAFVPLWLVLSYTPVCFSVWGGGFMMQKGVLDYSGGYVIHLSSGIAGFVAAYWVGPRLKRDREQFPPNNLLLMLAGAGMLWLGWSGFNGGDPFAANIDASMAVINTHICAASSLLTWLALDVAFFGKPSVIGAVQGMITGLVCITPAAGLVEGWAAIVMGLLSGSIPWWTMNVVHRSSVLLRDVDDTMAVFHTHAVAGALGGISVGLFAEPVLCNLFSNIGHQRGLFYSFPHHHGNLQGFKQLCWQLAGIAFVIAWNVIMTSVVCIVIRTRIPLRMSEEALEVGDDAVHGEEAYALWGDGATEKSERASRHEYTDDGSNYGKSGGATPKTDGLHSEEMTAK
ncbi:unnamed protein product [Calypogeia fissa]